MQKPVNFHPKTGLLMLLKPLQIFATAISKLGTALYNVV